MKSPTWIAPIQQFIDERCCIFEEGEENQLAHLQCHEQFKLLIQDLFVAHLVEVSVMPEEFEIFCSNGLRGDQQLHRVLVEQLLSVDDFLTFKTMMVRHNAELCREVVTFECADDDLDLDGTLSPTRGLATIVVANSINHVIEMSNNEWQMYEDQQFKSTLKAGSLAGTMRGGASLMRTINSFGGTMTLEVSQNLNLGGTLGSACGGGAFGGTLVSSLGGTMTSQLAAEMASDLVSEMVSNLDLMCEEARLGANIALQLQLEEERLQQVQAGAPPMQLPPSAGCLSAPLMALPPQIKEGLDPAGGPQDEAPAAVEVPRIVQVLPLQPRPWGFKSAPLVRLSSMAEVAEAGAPAAAATPGPAAEAPAPLPPRIGFTSSPLCFRPAALKLPESPAQDGGHPAAPECLPPLPETPRSHYSGVQPQTSVQEMASNLAEWRQRAKQAMEGAEEPGGRRPPRMGPMAQAASDRPSEEERRQRAEHLRRQRGALIAKRHADREQKVAELPARRGRHAADVAFATSEERRAAGRRLIAELTPRAAAPGAAQPAGAAAAADQMRQALTAQLRQTLCSSMVSDAGLLQDQISQLHVLRRQGAAP
ncbi:unnamed protein product [Prorocentrum cordatum]|uniref:Cilia- and flagella-associated protein 36 n=1 Tax=Prorocentrum cordatum TaxID=2364126 RepID=A0ABN9PGZ8_9DINO|nr:unnamed protein product [Polarella glacialis]